MARPEVTGRKPIQANAADHGDAYSIDEFCARHRISPQLFYKLKPRGLMPVTFNVGTRVLIRARLPTRGVARGKTSTAKAAASRLIAENKNRRHEDLGIDVRNGLRKTEI